jgi:putative oxidoreductase
MKKLISTNYSAGAFNAAMLFLRLIFGVLMMNHGYDKLVHFTEYKAKFMNFLGLGSTVSLLLVVFA